nr:hypothetical protein GCM10020185_08730 [Pseudomonas brassicacearum subsp. brassicacearum]
MIVIDIDATANAVEPNYAQIAKLAAECRMPLCYGGGIRTAQQAKNIIALGVEKVAISSAAFEKSAFDQSNRRRDWQAECCGGPGS